jgi:hypothetical protein
MLKRMQVEAESSQPLEGYSGAQEEEEEDCNGRTEEVGTEFHIAPGPRSSGCGP